LTGSFIESCQTIEMCEFHPMMMLCLKQTKDMYLSKMKITVEPVHTSNCSSHIN